jgi:hypothetical protein
MEASQVMMAQAILTKLDLYYTLLWWAQYIIPHYVGCTQHDLKADLLRAKFPKGLGELGGHLMS